MTVRPFPQISPGDLRAGVLAGLTAVPVALATALLVFGSQGAAFTGISAAAAMYSLIVAGVIVALLGNSSPMIPVPIIGPNLVLSSLVATVAGIYAGSPDQAVIVIASLALCVLIAGVWQIFLGVSGMAAAGNFVPYPVMVGFLNGLAVLTVVSQLRPLFRDAEGVHVFPAHRVEFIFMALLFALIFFFPSISRARAKLSALPGPLAALVIGTAIFHLAGWLAPQLDLGPELGAVEIPLIPVFTLSPWFVGDWFEKLQPLAHVIGAHAIAAIGIATIETFLSMTLIQNATDIHFGPRRQISAFGIANAALAPTGGIIVSGQPAMSMMAVNAGGRTRLTAWVMVATVAVIGLGFTSTLAYIPIPVLSAILIATAFRVFDPWTLRLFPAILNRRRPMPMRLRALYDLLVVAIVMGMTIFYSVLGGVTVGVILSCAIFIIRMRQSVVRGTLWDNQARSKRVRTAQEESIIAQGGKRAVLKLQGILFFGNANELAARVKRVQQQAAVVVLDCKRIAEIDVSGANVVRAMVERSRRGRYKLHVCNVPDSLIDSFAEGTGIAKKLLLRDLDNALAQVEDDILQAAAHNPPEAGIPLGEIDFLRGLRADELALLDREMPRRHFTANQVICREGESGDRMWLILKGNVSVALSSGERVRRLASLGAGTFFGEMALIEHSTRAADIIADDDVECRELSRDMFDRINAEHPALAAKILRNLSAALALRLRSTNADLRVVLDEFL